MLREIIISLRPRQWYKNFLVFLGVFLTGGLFNQSQFYLAILAFVFFCLLSSAIYILNDIADRKLDQNHPIKRERPIASGELNIAVAGVSSVVLIMLAIFGAYITIDIDFVAILMSFLMLMVLYSFYLKSLFIVDAILISSNFSLRVLAGFFAIQSSIPFWFLLVVFLLALMLVFGKRKHEQITLKTNANQHRNTLSSYYPALIDQYNAVAVSALIISYALFTYFVAENVLIYLTIPVIIFTVFRYLSLVHDATLPQANPVTYEYVPFITDRGIFGGLLAWVLILFMVIYM